MPRSRKKSRSENLGVLIFCNVISRDQRVVELLKFTSRINSARDKRSLVTSSSRLILNVCCACESSSLAASEMRERESGNQDVAPRSRKPIIGDNANPRFCFPSSHSFSSSSFCETAKRRSGFVEFVTLLTLFPPPIATIGSDHRYAIGFLTKSSSRPLASVYNYV